jgi:hypothetical protein
MELRYRCVIGCVTELLSRENPFTDEWITIMRFVPIKMWHWVMIKLPLKPRSLILHWVSAGRCLLRSMFYRSPSWDLALINKHIQFDKTYDIIRFPIYCIIIINICSYGYFHCSHLSLQIPYSCNFPRKDSFLHFKSSLQTKTYYASKWCISIFYSPNEKHKLQSASPV